MLRHGVRLSVAILTFTIGLALVWALQLISGVETAVVNRFFNNAQVSAIPAVFDATEETNQVYRVLIQRRYTNKTKLVVLQSKTTGDAMYEDDRLRKVLGHNETFQEMVKDWFPEAELQTLNNYLECNKTSEPLQVQNLGIPYELITMDDSEDQLQNFWEMFEKRYPRASEITFFSNVGFNEKHDQALVYTGHICGGLCGSGHYILLTKVNGRWEVENESASWVS